MEKSNTDAAPPRRIRGASRFRPGPRLVAAACLCTAIIVLCACSPAALARGRSSPRPVLRILGYNVQNLFDDHDDGGEYVEYTSAGGWSRSDYYQRLERLDEAIRLASGNRLPEIVVLAEIENAGVGETLAREFLRRYRWVVAEPSVTGATGVVVLSRLQPDDVRVHAAVAVDLAPASARLTGDALDGDPQVRSAWHSRALVETVLEVDRAPLRLFAAHWKSQSGGEAATEPRRLVEARLFRTASSLPRPPGSGEGAGGGDVLLVGDLNEDLEEYEQHRRQYPTALAPLDDAVGGERAAAGIRFVYPGAAAGAEAPAGAYMTGWPRTAGAADGPRGSYAYRGEWERLDHAFLRLPSPLTTELRPVVVPSLLRDGVPNRYDPRSGYGVSDHLPVMITLSRRPAR